MSQGKPERPVVFVHENEQPSQVKASPSHPQPASEPSSRRPKRSRSADPTGIAPLDSSERSRLSARIARYQVADHTVAAVLKQFKHFLVSIALRIEEYATNASYLQGYIVELDKKHSCTTANLEEAKAKLEEAKALKEEVERRQAEVNASLDEMEKQLAAAAKNGTQIDMGKFYAQHTQLVRMDLTARLKPLRAEYSELSQTTRRIDENVAKHFMDFQTFRDHVFLSLDSLLVYTTSASERLDRVEIRLGKVEKKVDAGFAKMDERFEAHDARLTGVETRLTGVETRLTGVETRLTGVETRLDRVETRLDRVETRLDRVETRLVNLEKKVDTGFTKIDQNFQRLIKLIEEGRH